MSRMTRSAVCLAFAITNVRAVAAQGPAPVAGRPYQFWDVLEADGGARKVYFRNDAAFPITITQVVIEICENTRQLCGTYPSNLLVPVGKTVVAFKIERLDRKLSWRFNYTFRTHIESPNPGGFAVGPDGARTSVQIVPLDSLVPGVPAVATNGMCGKIDIPGLPAGHKSLLMVFGTPSETTARQVMVRYNGSGIAYEYSDTRRQLGGVGADALMTSISIDPVRESVLLRNSGGGQPQAFFRATAATVMTSAVLGQAGEMAARIWKECGGAL